MSLTDEARHAFDALKDRLTSPPILGFTNYNLPFQLHTDACLQGLGAVLYQEQEGQSQVIGYASRSLKPSERHYPAHKLEFLALKWAVCDKFRDYLYGRKFDAYTDSNPMSYVLSSAKLDATGHRWLAELSLFDFQIHYKSGKMNVDAGTLSRPAALYDTDTDELDSEEVVTSCNAAIIQEYHSVFDTIP